MAQALFYSSNAVAMTLGAGIASGDTTCNLSSASGLPASFPFKLLIGWGTGQQEVVHCTALAGTVATIARGQDGTTAQAHSIGATVVHGVSAREFNDLELHVGSNSSVHGVAGNVVGTTDTQTLSSKTLSAPTVTGTLSVVGTETYAIGAGGTTQRVRLTDDGTLSYYQTDHPVIFAPVFSGVWQVKVDSRGVVGNTPLVVRGAPGQTAPIFSVQNDSGTVLGGFDSAGNISAANLSLTSWTNYTPTFTNCTTPNGNFAYKLQGKTLFLRGWITAGTATGAGPITISLPATLSGVSVTQLVQAEVAAALQLWTVNGGSTPTVITSAAFTAGQSLGAIFSATLEVA